MALIILLLLPFSLFSQTIDINEINEYGFEQKVGELRINEYSIELHRINDYNFLEYEGVFRDEFNGLNYYKLNENNLPTLKYNYRKDLEIPDYFDTFE